MYSLSVCLRGFFEIGEFLHKIGELSGLLLMKLNKIVFTEIV